MAKHEKAVYTSRSVNKQPARLEVHRGGALVSEGISDQ